MNNFRKSRKQEINYSCVWQNQEKNLALKGMFLWFNDVIWPNTLRKSFPRDKTSSRLDACYQQNSSNQKFIFMNKDSYLTEDSFHHFLLKWEIKKKLNWELLYHLDEYKSLLLFGRRAQIWVQYALVIG